MKLSKKIALRAVLLGTMAMPMLMSSAYAQQEMDPTWYDPWATTSKVSVHPAQAKPVAYKNQGKLNPSSAERPRIKKVLHTRVPQHTHQAPTILASK
jgi:hypothetical protein